MSSESRLAMFLAVLFLVAMCSSRVACAAPPTDPCSLLTPTQVSATLGVPIGPGEAQGKFECLWLPPGSSNFNARKLARLHIVGSVGTLKPVDQFNTMKMPVPFNKSIVKTPVSGLGDDAVYITVPEPLGTGLAVKKGNFVFQIRVHGFPVEETKAKEKALALDVLARL